MRVRRDLILKAIGKSPAQIAKALGVHRSTIIREFRRNSTNRSYDAHEAQRKAQKRKTRSSARKMSIGMIAMVEEKLKLNWSPEQISGWLKNKGKSMSATKQFTNIFGQTKNEEDPCINV